ncbi:YkvA family protein [Paracidovorax cattleyae]|uniref:Uncharacterized membrane protein YkvA, DUF1232 family n=1 Tax=Paracidovorax cattleyae TaxID=80868 RepID=A0A1H0NP35_9BURK|nr:DUF1232 domain-containing protein [Paracidovorax cattleyae]AVS75036.1 DUF1232 domain-containing protein [Paracidovorax cattleyae]SDO94120.1 Uncharacterized membrane protein YkvA, DUF1232 family [Paracidovorax cattleyae]
MPVLASLRQWARRLKTETLNVYFAACDPRTPRSVRLLALCVAAYPLSPIDRIPNFIPVLGYLDGVILGPPGIALVVRLLPPDVLESARRCAGPAVQRPLSAAMAIVFVPIWIAGAAWLGAWARRRRGSAA